MKKSKLIAIIAGAVVAVGAAAALIFFLINNAANDEIKIYDTDAFFLASKEDGDTKYALFRNNGERLTDFIYSHAESFVNGYALVRHTDGRAGIIDHNGKMTVDFGVYDNIAARVGIYEAIKGSDSVLIRGNGEVLASGYEDYVFSKEAPYVAVRYGEDQYTLYNALGEKLSEFRSKDAPVFSDRGKKSASALSSKDQIIILSNRNFKVAETAEASAVYSIEDATENGKIITFREYNKYYSNDAKRAIYNKSFKEFGDECNSLALNDNIYDEDNVYITCKKDGKDYLIRNNEISEFNLPTYSSGLIVYDENHFANYDSDAKKVDIYVDGKKKLTVDADRYISPSGRSYAVVNRAEKKITLYDLDANVVYTLENAASSSELSLDKNGNIIFRDGKQEGGKKYSLINRSGDKIAGNYESITVHGDYYYVNYKESDVRYSALLDKEGKVIISGEYDSIQFGNDDTVIIGSKGYYPDRKVDLFDVQNKTIKASFECSSFTIREEGYLRVQKSDNTIVYYTLDGKEILKTKD